MMLSGTSSAPASTIMMASFVPATVRFIRDCSLCSKVGLTINWPSIMPTRTDPVGPSHGISDCQSNGRTDHRHDIGFTVRIYGHDGSHDDYIVIVSFWKQRPQWSVHQSGAKGSLFARSAFSFYKTARNLSCCVHSFFVITTQWKKSQCQVSVLWML